MQMTIELPDELVERLEPEREHLAEIIERGLRQRWSESSGLGREVISFLAGGPKPGDILSFRPSADSLERARTLLRRAKQGPLTAAEEAEMDEIANLDHLIALIKAEARRHSQAA